MRRQERENGSKPRAKRSLGQNFLVSAAVAGKIVEAVDPQPGELIFEIGPGQGALTVPLGKTGSNIVEDRHRDPQKRSAWSEPPVVLDLLFVPDLLSQCDHHHKGAEIHEKVDAEVEENTEETTLA